MEDLAEFLKPHIIPQYRDTFLRMMASASTKSVVDDIRLRGRHRSDAWDELRKLFLEGSGGKTKGKRLSQKKKRNQDENKKKMQYIWFEEISDFNRSKK